MKNLTLMLLGVLVAACSGQADIGTTKQPVTLCNTNSCSGPAPAAPNYKCADGSIAGPACVQASNGSCSWQILSCPSSGGGSNATCTTQECGPAPGVANYQCADGTIAGPSCGRLSDGSCGWTIVACPTTNPCMPSDCSGPAPGAPNYLCSDGKTIAGPACEPDSSGTCNWTIVQCP